MSDDFIVIYDTRDNTSYIININQIVWFEMNSRTLMLSAPSDKGLFYIDDESVEEILKAINRNKRN